MDHQRIFGLDLLRCIAILIVLFTHSIPLLNPALLNKIPVYTGYWGVELFFVLSGFLIGTILLKIHYQSGEIDLEKIRAFWIRRWFRTLPNYYLMFIIYALAVYFSHHLAVFSNIKYLSYLLFLQNTVSYQPNDFFQIAWSLSIEEWFYLSFPVLLFLISRLFKGNKSASFLTAVVIIIVVELLARIYVYTKFNNYWDEGVRKMMPLRLDSICYGVLAAFIRYNYLSFWNRTKNISGMLGMAGILGLILYFSVSYAAKYHPTTWDHNLRTRLFLNTFFFSLTSFCIALTIPFITAIKINRNLFSRGVTFISEISYSIYLSHLLIILILARLFKHFGNLNYINALLFFSVWVVTLTVSAFQYKYFELKMTAFREIFTKKEDAVSV